MHQIESMPTAPYSRRPSPSEEPDDKTDRESFIIAARAVQTVDYSVEVANVQNPTLIVVASEDQAPPPAMCDDLAAQMPAANFRLLPRLAHAPQLQDSAALGEAIRLP